MHQAEHLQGSRAAFLVARQDGDHTGDQRQDHRRAPPEDGEEDKTCERRRADQVEGSVHQRCFLA
ncbi:hypothetical protein GCM10009634_55170 [Saccharothrix xinjiangensis]